jgi:hypothetical protein
MNLLEIAIDAFGPFLDNEKKPLNVGEVMNLWVLLIRDGANTSRRSSCI